MPKFRKVTGSLVVDAVQWTGENKEEIEEFCGKKIAFLVTGASIVTINPVGIFLGYPGCWVVKDSSGGVISKTNSCFKKNFVEIEEKVNA